jgi:hypothetical protein
MRSVTESIATSQRSTGWYYWRIRTLNRWVIAVLFFWRMFIRCHDHFHDWFPPSRDANVRSLILSMIFMAPAEIIVAKNTPLERFLAKNTYIRHSLNRTRQLRVLIPCRRLLFQRLSHRSSIPVWYWINWDQCKPDPLLDNWDNLSDIMWTIVYIYLSRVWVLTKRNEGTKFVLTAKFQFL